MLKLSNVSSYAAAAAPIAPPAPTDSASGMASSSSKAIGPAARVTLSDAARAALETDTAVQDKTKDAGIVIEIGGRKVQGASKAVINDDLTGV